MRRITFTVVSLFFVVSALNPSLSAGTGSVITEPLVNPWILAKKKNKHINLKQAVKKVKRKTGGRILSADTVNRNGRNMHRIKALLPSGEVRLFYFDAK